MPSSSDERPAPPTPSAELRRIFGGIDIYVFDQLLRGRFDHRRRILDAGCGSGRNLPYFLRSGFEVFGIDGDPDVISALKSLAKELGMESDLDNFQVGKIAALPWPDLHFDAIISSAVLHFAENRQQFGCMLEEMWRVLRPGGLFVARLASVIGLEAPIELNGDNRAALPDGSVRFLVDEAFLHAWTQRLDALQLDPIKTTNVQNQRCMTTWVLQKRAS